jgi:signal transduction histidine kinase
VTAATETDVTSAHAAATTLLVLEEQDRNAVAASLHDGPVQGIVAMRFLADLASTALDRGDLVAVADRLAELRAAAQEAQAETRRTMRALHGRCLDGEGLAEALESHAVASHAGGGPLTVVRLDYTGAVPVVVAITLHRVAQAALSEAHHRGALAAAIEVVAADGGLRLTVTDHGRRPDPTLSPSSSALARWSARVPLLGGRLDLTVSPGQQHVVCWLPVDSHVLGGQP